ncbi:uncharacterized protein LOC132704918 [Cylas formicarius]|uniref:uncharacterized protein LOC132704918 n=1 Tax=Cylas formicarius TaxID=197179 RepID=UPI002958444D|nr:uncharacterized protein LOC132704918 [Cylas formicarius]
MPKNKDYNLKLIHTVYNQLPAFTDIFDEDTFYMFVFIFIISTIVVVFILSRFITIKAVE